jgi:hypothetical protein
MEAYMTDRFLAVALLVAAGPVFAQVAAPAPSGSPQSIRIAAQNGSAESGTATLTSEEGNKTKVEISLKGQPKGVQQPAHLHAGGCANLDPKPKYGLENVVNGKSTTIIPVDAGVLFEQGLALNVHKSKQDIQTYVACGDLSKTNLTKSARK